MSDNQEILNEFATESLEHLGDVEQQLLAIEAGGENADIELINRVFRSVHSIKGASGFLGLVTIGELSHALENVLNLLRNRELVPNSDMTDVLLSAIDTLRGLIGNVNDSNGVDIAAHVEALGRVVSAQAAPEARASLEHMVPFVAPCGAMEVSEAALNAQRTIGHHLFILEYDLLVDLDPKGKTPLDLIREVSEYGEILDARFPTDDWGGLEDDLPATMSCFVLLGTLIEDADLVATAVGLPVERVQPVLYDLEPSSEAAASDTSETASTNGNEASPPATATPAASASMSEPPVARQTAPTPAPVPSQPSPPPNSNRAATPRTETPAAATVATETSIRVAVTLLDHLMNLAGELVLGRNQLVQMIATQDQNGLESVGARLNQVTSELQEAIMQARMQAIGTVFNKFPRVVRDLSNKLGKQCDLVVEGKEVELDKSLLESIADPLTHLIRNSVDHGVETPQDRVAAGKSPQGTVTLKAWHQAGKVNILISDDGKGIDPGRLKAKAVEKGILTAAEAKELDDAEAVRLIFHAGFSTAEQVTDVSGRGVGMDVVKTNIEKAGGTVDIESKPGKGTSVHIRLPLTLAIIPSLIVRCGEDRYAVPQVGINELVRIKASEVHRKIERVHGAEVLRLRGSLLPLVRLDDALGKCTSRCRFDSPRDGDGAADGNADANAGHEPDVHTLHIIVVEVGALRYGIVADGLQDSEEIVVKPLGSHLKGTPCLAGATILGDGRVALILDVAGIAAHCRLQQTRHPEMHAAEHAASRSKELQTMLLFTNDPTEQFAIPMGLVSRIERVRADLIDRVGGQEVLQYRGTSLPLLSLEQYVTAKPRPTQETLHVAVFRIARQEIGLIAPKLVDIRQIPADLDTVTFRETGILGSLLIENHATRVIDLSELVSLARPAWLAEETDRNTHTCGRRVLLAEDSDFFRKQVKAFLEADGYEVVACEDGAVAWQALQEADTPFDVVVTDIEMPDLDGYALTRQIRNDERFAGLPVIAVTSLAGQEDVERGKAAGVNDYQIKLDRDRLLETVGRLSKSMRQESHS